MSKQVLACDALLRMKVSHRALRLHMILIYLGLDRDNDIIGRGKDFTAHMGLQTINCQMLTPILNELQNAELIRWSRTKEGFRISWSTLADIEFARRAR